MRTHVLYGSDRDKVGWGASGLGDCLEELYTRGLIGIQNITLNPKP